MRDGASRRTPGGCAGRRPAQCARARSARNARAGARSPTAGVNRIAPAPRADRGAEVHVLRVHEVSLVEQADGLGVRAADEQARAAHPVDEPLATGEPLDQRRPMATVGRPRARASSAAARPAARSSVRTTARASRSIDQPRARRRARPASASSRSTSRSIAPAGTIVSLFSSSSRFAPCSRECRCCSRRRNPRLRTSAISAYPATTARRRSSAAIGRGVVDDDDLVRRAAGGVSVSDSQAAPPRSARALKLTMMIETSVTRGHRHVRWPRGFRGRRHPRIPSERRRARASGTRDGDAGSSSSVAIACAAPRTMSRRSHVTTPHRRTPRARSACRGRRRGCRRTRASSGVRPKPS